MRVVRRAASKPIRSGEIDADYLALIRRFPLRCIGTAGEMKEAGRILDEHIGRDDLSPGERDYLGALVHFVRKFEERTARQKLLELTPREILNHLMHENGMSTSDLGVILGSRGLASEVLNGKRGLSKTHILKLAERFHVDPVLFLAPGAVGRST